MVSENQCFGVVVSVSFAGAKYALELGFRWQRQPTTRMSISSTDTFYDMLCTCVLVLSRVSDFSLDFRLYPVDLSSEAFNSLTLDVLYHITPQNTNCSPEPQDPCTINYWRYFERSESFSSIHLLCLLVKTDMEELKISQLLLSHNRTGVGTLIFFNRKLRVNLLVAVVNTSNTKTRSSKEMAE